MYRGDLVASHKIDRYRDETYQTNVSEFSASLTDIFAVRYFTAECDRLLFHVNNGKTNQLIPLFFAMKCFWQRMRVIVYEEIRAKYDKRLETMEEYINTTKKRLDRNLPFKPKYEKIKEIEKLYMDMLVVKQMCGCGFAMRREKSLDERLENTMLK